MDRIGEGEAGREEWIEQRKEEIHRQLEEYTKRESGNGDTSNGDDSDIPF